MGFLKSFMNGNEKPICLVIDNKIKMKIDDVFEFHKQKYKISRISRMKDMVYGRKDLDLYIIFGTKEKNKADDR